MASTGDVYLCMDASPGKHLHLDLLPSTDVKNTSVERDLKSVPALPVPPAEMNVTELYESLVATETLPHVKADADYKEEEAKSIKPVDFSQPETLKLRQPGLVALLHSGIPCSSCGIRFLPEECMKYRQHLDWHFCQNRRQKDSGNDQSRGWYFSLSDWMQYEEIEDPEESGMTWRTA